MSKQFDLLKYRAEDGGILDAWCDLYGLDWIYVTGHEWWYHWTGTHWEKDQCQGIQKQVLDLMDTMNRAAKEALAEAIRNEDEDGEMVYKAHISATKRSKARVSSIEGMAQAQRAVAAGMLDSGNVLNLKNGTFDLDTLSLHPHDPQKFLTYCLDYEYDPTAQCPRFEQFLWEVLIVSEDDNRTDLELCTLFQELVGYSLTNDCSQEAMIWLSGEGGNGKTVAITIIQSLLGPLSSSVDFQALGLPGNYDLAGIAGKRVLFSTEAERGGKLAEGYLKKIVSGERINARPIYGKPFEFKSVSKVWWGMNNKPPIKDTTDSVWRRLKLIPFNRTFTESEKDVHLLDKLWAELSGILNFALDGLRRLRKQGRFTQSRAVSKAVEEYREESNPVAQWLKLRTVVEDNPCALQSALYGDYVEWCKDNGRQNMNSMNFGIELKRLNFTSKRVSGGVIYPLRLVSQRMPT